MPAATTLQGRLLCASVCTYSIASGQPFVPPKNLYDGAGFLSPPTTFSAGPLGIHAALVGRTSDGIVIAVRGTLLPRIKDPASLLDWMNDLLAMPISAPPLVGEVHSGFWNALECLWAPMKAALTPLLASGAPLLLTGHSKGGAVAPLAAARLQVEKIAQAKSIITFAAPRCGDADFAANYDASFQHTRYEYQDDLVPHLPPSPILLAALKSIPGVQKRLGGFTVWDYESLGKLQFINWNGKIVGNSFTLPWKRMEHLAKLVAQGDFAKIGADHESGCGGGYMSTLCPTGICP